MTKRKLKRHIKGVTNWLLENNEPSDIKEWYQQIPNLKYMENLSIPTELPIILVSASKVNLYQFHSEILNGLNNTKHIELDGTHHIYKEHREEIVNYIKGLVGK